MMLLRLFKELSLHPKNATELKGLILQLAVQGKLTAKWREENPDVEPASELLKRIEEEKDRLVKEKKLRREKLLPPLKKEEIPFKIPENWEWCRMYDYLDVRDGTHDTPKYVDNGYPLVTSKNLYSKKLDLSDVKYISQKDHLAISKRSKVEKNDILFAMIGSIGNPVIVDVEPSFSIKNVALFKYYRVDLCEPKYILNYLEYATKDFKENSDGAVQSFVSLKKLRLKELPVPPLEEQHAIVSTVNQLFAEVEQLEQLVKERIQLKQDFAASALQRLVQAGNINGEWAAVQQHFHTFFNEKSNVKKLRETILQLAVQGKLTTHWRKENPDTEPATELLKRITTEKQQLIQSGKIKKEKPLPPIKEEEIPFELPEGWEWCRLGDVISLKSGQDLKPNEYSDNDVIGLPYITGASNLQNEKVIINRWTNAPRSIAYKGELLITCKGSGVGKMGWLDAESAHIARQIMSIKSYVISLEYVKLILDVNVPSFQKNANGLIPGIDRTTVLTTLFSCPPLQEQHAIVTTVNTLMALCDSLEQEVGQQERQVEELMRSCVREVVHEEMNERDELGMAAEPRIGYDAKK